MGAVRTFLGRLRKSRSPPIRWLRAVVRRNFVLMAIVRAVVPVVLDELEALTAKIQEWIRPPFNPKLRALLDARSIGGGLSLPELDLLWQLGAKHLDVLCIGDRPALEQMEIVLRRSGARSVSTAALRPPPELNYLARFDQVVAAPDAHALADMERLKVDSGLASNFLILPGDPSARSRYRAEYQLRSKRNVPVSGSLRERLDENGRIRVVFLNDIGCQFGAGIAQRRQAASLLLNGWDVTVVAWSPGRELAAPKVSGIERFNNWHGVHALRRFPTGKIHDSASIIERVASKVASFNPHVVIVGNIHGANWPTELLLRLQKLGALVVAYMHDCYFVTGRCAHPGTCVKFRTGCDATCPTPNEYPRLAPDRIASAWQARGEVFAGVNSVPLVANSNWTRDIAKLRFGTAARTEVVHLGLDESLFAPFDKRIARELLGIPQDKLVVTMGAVDIENQWKGGPLFRAVYEGLQSRTDVEMVLFGRASETFTSAKSFGLVRDERLMPLIYGAADIFVSTATAESFGQTLLEASACGVPVVAFNVGGVPDVVVHEQTGLLVDTISAPHLLSSIDRLIHSPEVMKRQGQNGRIRVENNFSLARQAEAWVECLKRLC